MAAELPSGIVLSYSTAAPRQAEVSIRVASRRYSTLFLSLRGKNNIVQQHRPCHRPHSARVRRQPPGDLGDRGIDVPREFRLTTFCHSNPCHANVEYGC